MWSPYPPPPLPAPSARSRGPVVVFTVATALVGAWIVVATVGLQAGGWLVTQIVEIAGLHLSGLTWPILAIANLVSVAAPAAVVWALATRLTPGQAPLRGAGRAWTVAGVVGGLLGALRAIPEAHNEILLLATALVATTAALLLYLFGEARSEAGRRRPLTGFGLAAGLLVLLPWLWTGALGGIAETILAVAAAVAFGWLASTILTPSYFRGYARSRVHLVLLGGLSAGVTLVPLAAGLGGRGVNLAELVILPALGFVAAALASATFLGGPDASGVAMGSAPVAALIAAAAVGPLAFVDPEETSLLLGTDDVGWWALVAALVGLGIALVAGVGYGFGLRRWRGQSVAGSRWSGRLVPGVVTVVVLVAGVAVYVGAGRPGLYGDRLFVVLKDQADLSGLDAIADRPTRIQATYDRLVSHATSSQASLRASLDRWGLHYTPYYLVNAILVDGGPLVREWLSQRSDVDRVLLDQRLRPLPVSVPIERGNAPAPDGAPQWNIAQIQAPRVWSEFGDQGQGIVIGTSDSGVDANHPDLRGSFRGGDDSWFDPWNGTRTPAAHNGHGTHTIATALGRNGIGVAPQAQWIGCVNLDRNFGSPSHYLDCLQFMLAPFPVGGDPWRDGRGQDAPDILTNSWGCPAVEGCDADALLPATEALRAAGIFVVVAAGNTGPYCSSITDAPAPYPDVLTVGADDRNRQVASFSSRGPTPVAFAPDAVDDGRTKPDLVAPGVDVLSALPGGTYGVLDGTSMAAPHVAGVVALMWSANPKLIGDIDATTRILRDTATPVTATYLGDNPANSCGASANITGAGQVDAFAAVQAARSMG